mmetsp:Transcript_2578/g.2364  ORF Transcript_2578/g.2364 Transcript_2578/m.2364 type:complete len:178 (-) Transcript_2578:28-561(-)
MQTSLIGTVTPEEVLSHTHATSEFLCSLNANIFDIRFGSFRLRDMDTNTILLDLERDFEPQTEETRFISYNFPPEFLNLRTVGSLIYFSVGEYPVSNFRMIERHYFKDRLVQNYDFTIDFMIPRTINSREFIYTLPELTEVEKEDIMLSPRETKSDSFFFADGQLIMHVRAEYDYSG